jgi:hypothetical protein
MNFIEAMLVRESESYYIKTTSKLRLLKRFPRIESCGGRPVIFGAAEDVVEHDPAEAASQAPPCSKG